MNELENFMGKFGGANEPPTEETKTIDTTEPTALDAFFNKFGNSMESHLFYNDTVEVRFDKGKHKYYVVEELGNLIPVKGVTTVCHIIDRSFALTPWAAKKVADKILRIVPTYVLQNKDGTNPITLVPEMSVEKFTAYVMEAKKAPVEEKEEAGDIGHMAHECLEDSIRYALENTQDHIVTGLRNLPGDEMAATAARSAFNWMQAHNVRWIKTESKIFSKKYRYAGTMDGLALVDSCNDPTCCRKQFKDQRSLIDWKSSNYLYIEFLYQTAAYQAAEEEENGIEIEARWVLRLGKNEEEAGKFEPWYMGPEEFDTDFRGFIACYNLVEAVEAANKRVSETKSVVRKLKKEARDKAREIKKAEEKALKARLKAEKKVKREQEKKNAKEIAEKEKALLRAQRIAAKEKIKEEAKKLRQNEKLQKQQEVQRATPTKVQPRQPVSSVLEEVPTSKPAVRLLYIPEEK